MNSSFFFYDLETSGINPRKSRIMQFAGQRTDLDLKPIGQPYNILIKLTEDVLPDPDAILLTGITPQKTIEEGISEAEFCKLFATEIMRPGTCFTGYNNVRFDDEFMRFLLYRNYYDPYTWQWKDNCSRWDLLDVVRMTRALRPEGISWPNDEKGVSTNRLELVAASNKLIHDSAHDALSDVHATIAVADMIKTKQPKLFSYLYTMRAKKEVSKLVLDGKPFVYSSGRYASESEKTAVVACLGMHPTSQAALVYNLKHDPSPYLAMSIAELVDAWRYKEDRQSPVLPVKALQFNRSPAVAPLGVVDKNAMDRLQVSLETIKKHLAILKSDPDFNNRVSEAAVQMNIDRDKKIALNFNAGSAVSSVDEQLYDCFIPDADRFASNKLQVAKPDKLSNFADQFKDERLKTLLPLYIARNYPQYLTDSDRTVWELHRERALLGGGTSSSLARFGRRLQELSQTDKNGKKLYLIEELRLYAESIVPDPQEIQND